MPPKTNEGLAREIVNICDEDDSGSVYQKIITLLDAKDKEREEAVAEEGRRIWKEIVKLADDYNGDLDTNLDMVWPIMQIPPALTPPLTR